MLTREVQNEAALKPPTGRPRVAGPLVALAAVALAGSGIVFAWTRNSGPEAGGESVRADELQPAPIRGERAYAYLKRICEIGPRPAGSEANERQRKMVAEHFKGLGAEIREQPFTARHPLTGESVAMVNLIASWFPERTRRVVIAAHYDTRPYPDMESDPNRRRDPFIGANDGASGVALLMEISHHLKESPTEWGVDLVLFDGEELVFDRTGEYLLGSKEFARAYKADPRSGKAKYVYSAGILLDMVAGKEMQLPKEPYSVRFAGGLVREIWAVARALKAEAFRDEMGREVIDDHLPLNDAGIPTVDIIDFNYPQWHTADDLPEYCSPASLEQVGRVVTAWLARPMPTRKR